MQPAKAALPANAAQASQFAKASPAAPATAERLSHWLGWTDALSLSAALNGAAAASTAWFSADAEARECRRVRTLLAQQKAIADLDTQADFVPYRRRYQTRQQAMDTAIAALRGRVRAALAARSNEMARLAAVDVVMAQVLGPRERSLLASVPGRLERHFDRLRQAADETHPDAWREVFHKDFQDVLDAELEFRLQPVEGLLDALREKQPGIHE